MSVKPFLVIAREIDGLPCPYCISSTMNVIANKAQGQVSEMEMEGEHNILTHQGGYCPAKLLRRNYSGELYHITPWLQNESIELTSEHPVLTRRGWVVPTKLSREDMLFIPKHKIKKKDYLDITDYLTIPHTVKDGRVYKTFKNAVTGRINYREGHKIQRRIPLAEGFMRLCGYFVAEGCIQMPQSRKATFSLAFSKNEPELVEDARALIEKYLTHCVVIDTNTARQVRIHSHIVCNLFENLFGSKSYKKRVPSWLLHLPRHLQAEFFKGYFRGDGSIRLNEEESKANLSFTTTSKALAYQLRLLLVNLGILPAIYKVKRHTTSINGRILKNNTKYCYNAIVTRIKEFNKLSLLLNVGMIKSDTNIQKGNINCIEQKNGFWVKIKSIKKQKYSGIVYNFSVSSDPTYLVNNIVVHNCSVSQLVAEHVSNHLKTPIDILFSDESDSRMDAIAQYFIQNYGEAGIPTPVLYYNGILVIGVVAIQHYLGVLQGLMQEDAEYR